MRQRGRKGTASLSVVSGAFGERPEPPEYLSKKQAAVWKRVVGSEHPDFFKTEAVKALLVHYCRHLVTADELEDVVQKAMGPRPEGEKAVSLDDLDRLLKMRERETRACTTLATKMRLTNQSRYQSSVAATRARENAPAKPWNDVG
jgi:phage terminase small subunit